MITCETYRTTKIDLVLLERARIIPYTAWECWSVGVLEWGIAQDE